MTNVVKLRSEESVPPPLFAPGILFERLGWIVDWIKEAIQSDPTLLIDVYSLTAQRVHLIGLALAHTDAAEQRRLAPLLLRGRTRDILDTALGHRPRGLKRALSNICPDVLSPEGYRNLVKILDDPISFRFVAHSKFIDDDDLKKLIGIPTDLRPILTPFWVTLRGDVESGLKFLVTRNAAPSFDSLLCGLKSARQPQQISSYIKSLIDGLPLPTELPPCSIGNARRLDSSREIRDLAKRWENCLEKLYLECVNDGSCAIYLWDDSQAPAACAVERRGRLGWFLSDIKGPMNEDVDPRLLADIRSAFSTQNIVNDDIASSLIALIELGEGDRRKLRR